MRYHNNIIYIRRQLTIIMIKNPWVKKILSALAIIVFGYILWTLTFLFDFAYQSLIRRIIQVFISNNPPLELNWFPIVMHGSFMLLIGFISWLIYRTKWPVLAKAIYLTVPAAVVLVTIGILLYRWPIASYLAGAIIVISILSHFYQTKQPWQYYFAIIFTSITLFIFTLSGGEI